MKVIEINQKTRLVRHWLKWYVVTKGINNWQRLDIKKKPEKSIEQIANSLNKKYPARLPSILDEKQADKIVANNVKRAKRKAGGKPPTLS